jgi:catechol 2,3-dioxygenase
MADYPTRIGHAHIKVRDLDRAVAFYTRFFNLRVTEQLEGYYAFLSGGEFHHELALQNVGPAAPAAPSRGVGLYHIAFEVPDQAAFAQAFRALRAAGVPVAAVDHRISWAMYFSDPDGNGLEIYWDTRHLATGSELWDGQDRPLSAAQILSTT